MTLPSGEYTQEELNAFKGIFDKYYESIRNFAYFKTGDIDVAEDIVQETFIKVWEIRDTLVEDTVKSLLYAIAANSIKNHFRHKKVVLNFAYSKNNESENSESADADLQQQEMHNKLLFILNEMPEKSKEVFLLNRIEKLTYQEIAKRLDLSVKTIEKRMHQALVHIRKHLNYKI
ncbi:MAG TPA: RNA polymerase sigma-70 factor [Bacteroidales bacterium]|nr:RNA polymerase sigma-70 factor [Bacteroidales bacterium]